MLRTPKWPDAIPSRDGSKLVLGLNCGNASLHWSFFDQDLNPIVCWKTNIPKEEDFLFYYFPAKLQLDLFGFTSEQRKRNGGVRNSHLCRLLLQRRESVVTVYITSSNPSHEAAAVKLFEGLPKIIYRLTKEDFLRNDPQLSAHDTIGDDRIAGLMGAVSCFPNRRSHLVIDGGTALTMTTINTKKQVGGAIGVGPRIKLAAMTTATGKLPEINDAVLRSLMQDLTLQNRRLGTFVTDNTQGNMVGCVLKETTLLLCHYIQEWRTSLPKDIPNDQTPVVVLCGGDGNLFSRLLRPGHDGAIETTPETTAFLQSGEVFDRLDACSVPNDPKISFQLVYIPHVIHLGIQSLIKGQNVAETPENDARSKLVGQRVVVSGKRGTIVSVSQCQTGQIMADDLVSVYDETNEVYTEIKIIEAICKLTQAQSNCELYILPIVMFSIRWP